LPVPLDASQRFFYGPQDFTDRGVSAEAGNAVLTIVAADFQAAPLERRLHSAAEALQGFT
jgi:hypothetical protein